jgi:septal ring factor EnvC (AmiA/AmiB activator)
MKYRIYSRLLILVLLFFFENGYTQSKKDLEKQKASNLEKLKLSRELLEKTREKKKNSSYQVQLINKKIEYRNNLVSTYQNEIKYLENQVHELSDLLKENEAILDQLKEQYAEIIRKTYRNLEDDYVMMYLLSSEDINQGYERLKYIKYINQYRQNLYEEIEQKNDSLTDLSNNLTRTRLELEQSINNLKRENENLYKNRREKSQVISQLKGQENDIIKEIREREEAQRKIEAEIRRIIEEEARRAAAENRIYELTPEEKIISDDFFRNKGGLPWPTIQGLVTSKYGEHAHPVIPGIKIQSNGIDISTVPGTDVRSVFKGEVTVVSAILGANYTVIIKHGNYRTVYQNLVNVRVKSGDVVETKEIIGTVGTNAGNETKLHFELWNQMNVIDPELWLSK